MSVRQRAVDLLYAMCDRSNAQQIVAEMLSYLETADYSIREEIVSCAVTGPRSSRISANCFLSGWVSRGEWRGVWLDSGLEPEAHSAAAPHAGAGGQPRPGEAVVRSPLVCSCSCAAPCAPTRPVVSIAGGRRLPQLALEPSTAWAPLRARWECPPLSVAAWVQS